MGLWALPSFSRRHRVPAENRNEDEKPGAFARQSRERLTFPSPPLLVLALQEHSASCSMHRSSYFPPGSSHWKWVDETLKVLLSHALRYAEKLCYVLLLSSYWCEEI